MAVFSLHPGGLSVKYNFIYLFLIYYRFCLRYQCFVPGECSGTLMGIAVENGAEACLASCKEVESDGCKWFTVNEKDSFCNLFLNCDDINANSCPDCVSGEVTCSTVDLECNLPGLCLGNLEHSENTQSHQACMDSCAVYEGCNYYTYDPANVLCYLFSSCPSQSDTTCPECISGQPGCDLDQEMKDSYLMVAGGCCPDTNLVELISLDTESPIPDCLTQLAPLPAKVWAASGAALNQIPNVCGGHSGLSVRGSCYKYSAADDTWEESSGVAMETPRYFAGSVYHPTFGLVVSGGQDKNYAPTDSVEATEDGETFAPLPPLPLPSTDHCLAAIDGEGLFVAGGYTTSLYSKDAYMYTSESGGWTRLDDMPTARYGLSCGALTNKDGVVTDIIVAGGYNSTYLDTVEIYSVTQMAWKSAYSLPHALRYATVVPDGNSVLLVGGEVGLGEYVSTIYRYDPTNDSWTLLRAELSVARHWVTAMLVEKETFPECN